MKGYWGLKKITFTGLILKSFLSSYISNSFIFQGEMQQLREKLSIAERAAKTEAQLKVLFLGTS